MIFEQFRLSLVERDLNLLDFIEREKEEGPPSETPREDWLRETFSKEITFTHRRQRFHYVPDPELQSGINGIIVGRIGRRRKGKENEPPETGLRETEREAWHAMILMLDPSTNSDGQKLALQREQNVAQCFPVLKALVLSLNKRESRYRVDIEPLSEENSFWTFVGEHPNITTLTFEMIAPNMFGLEDDWSADMRDLKKTENADRAKFQTESKDGMNVDTPRVRKGVEHAGRGIASVRARAKDGAKFSSEDSVKVVQTPDKTDEISWNELLKLIVGRIFSVL